MQIISLTEKYKNGWKSLMRLYFQFYNFQTTDEHIDKVFDQVVFSDNGLHSLVAVLDDQVIGLANYIIMPDTFNGYNCYLSDLYVDNMARGHGVAEGLINEIATFAKSIGASSMYWLTAQDNYLAQKLYNKLAITDKWLVYEKHI